MPNKGNDYKSTEEGREYKSIEEVRSVFYPGSAAMLDLENEDVLELPASLAKSLQVLESNAKRATESEAEHDPGSNES
jgi:hypothetical protein